jgi:hypothetical protein
MIYPSSREMDMTTAAEIEAAFASIPTVVVEETVRIVVRGVAYDAEELFKGVFEGTRTFAYTDADGVSHIVRLKN